MAETGALSRFQLVRPLGEDLLSTWDLTQDVKTGKHYFLRKLKPASIPSGRTPAAIAKAASQIAKKQRQQPEPVVQKIATMGCEKDSVWVALPAGEAGRLPEWIAESRPSPQDIVDRFAPLATGLDRLHRRGAVHGQVTAETILVAPDDALCLAEFATTHAIRQWSDGKGQALGHDDPASVPGGDQPPEIAGGWPYNARAEQYTFARALLRALAGTKQPFPDASVPTADLLAQSGLAEPARSVLEKALAPDPAARHANCGDLILELRQAMASGSNAMPKLIGAGVAALILIAGTFMLGRQHGSASAAEHSRSLRDQQIAGLADRFQADFPVPASQKVLAAISESRPEDSSEVEALMNAGPLLQREKLAQTTAALKSLNIIPAEPAAGSDPPAANGNQADVVWLSPPAEDDKAPPALIHGPLNGQLSSEVQLTLESDLGKPFAEYELTARLVDRTGSTIGEAVTSPLDLASPKATVQVASPPPAKGWLSAGQLRLEVALHEKEAASDPIWTWNSPDYSLGTLQWESREFEVTPQAVAAKLPEFAVPTGMTFQPGDLFEVAASGSTQPVREGLAKLMNIDGTPIPVEGLKQELGYPASYTLVSPDAPFGAVLYRIAQEGMQPEWTAFTRRRSDLTPTAPRAGQLELSFNSIVKEDGKPLSASDLTKSYWLPDSGTCTVTVRRGRLTPGTSGSAQPRHEILASLGFEVEAPPAAITPPAVASSGDPGTSTSTNTTASTPRRRPDDPNSLSGTWVLQDQVRQLIALYGARPEWVAALTIIDVEDSKSTITLTEVSRHPGSSQMKATVRRKSGKVPYEVEELSMIFANDLSRKRRPLNAFFSAPGNENMTLDVDRVVFDVRNGRVLRTVPAGRSGSLRLAYRRENPDDFPKPRTNTTPGRTFPQPYTPGQTVPGQTIPGQSIPGMIFIPGRGFVPANQSGQTPVTQPGSTNGNGTGSDSTPGGGNQSGSGNQFNPSPGTTPGTGGKQ